MGWQCLLQAVNVHWGSNSRLAPVLRTSQPLGASSGELHKSPRGSDVQLGLKATAEPFIMGRLHPDESLKRWAVLIITYLHAKLFLDGARLCVGAGQTQGHKPGALEQDSSAAVMGG